ncbi:MAG: DUF3618 domain-containing protein [Microbacteriaceae bacterium]
MSEDSTRTKIAITRTELENTLDAIEDKLNVPKQWERLNVKARIAYQRNPVPFIVGATAAVIVVGGLIAWAFLSDD